ncbi:hypothetical protein ACTACK_12935 [Pseudomonas syringae]|uniref:hypothetical protein n=1 Tax=Pseudomonas syringae TaxID=317 RepID=UPI003F75266E
MIRSEEVLASGRPVWTLTKDGQLQIAEGLILKQMDDGKIYAAGFSVGGTNQLKDDPESRESFYSHLSNARPAEGSFDEQFDRLAQVMASSTIRKIPLRSSSPRNTAEQALCDAVVALVQKRGHCDEIVADATSIATALVAGLKVISESGNTP